MLHIAVHRDDGIAIGTVQPARQSNLVPVVAREEHGLYMRVALLQSLQHRAAVIGRAVIDEDELPGITVTQFRHDVSHGFIEMRDIVLLIEYRHDDGYRLRFR